MKSPLSEHGDPSSQARRCLLLLLLTIVLFPGHASAQLKPGPDQTRLELPPQEEPKIDLTPPGRILRPIPIPADDPAANLFAGGEISVRGFRFVGNEALSDEILNTVTRAYIGEGRRYGALLEARDRVTRAYVDAGYISSGAVLPDQPIRDGLVEIQIIEGHLTTIEVKTDGRLRDRYLTSRLGLDGREEALNLGALRHRLRILKRDPNIESISSELVPGEERGDSILSVVVREPGSWRAGLDFDDYVTPAIGGFRNQFLVGHRNATGWGEQITLTYSIATRLQEDSSLGAGQTNPDGSVPVGLHDIDLRISIPINRWDTTLEVRARRAWSQITERPIDQFDIQSRTQAYSLHIRHPVLRERTYSLGAFGSAEWKRGKSTLLGGFALSLDPNDNGISTVSALRAGVDGWWRSRQRAISGRLTLSLGLDILDAGADGVNLNGKFHSSHLQIQAVEFLPWYGLRILTRVSAQLADDSLLGLEQYALGGHASVRGFRENLLVRDQGIVGSIELRIPLPTIRPINRLEFGVFGDGGYARNRRGNARDSIAAVGVGLHANLDWGIRLALEWAESLKDPTGNLVGKHIQDDGIHFSMHFGFP